MAVIIYHSYHIISYNNLVRILSHGCPNRPQYRSFPPVRPSVRLSVRRVQPSNSKIKRSRQTKIGVNEGRCNGKAYANFQFKGQRLGLGLGSFKRRPHNISALRRLPTWFFFKLRMNSVFDCFTTSGKYR